MGGWPLSVCQAYCCSRHRNEESQCYTDSEYAFKQCLNVVSETPLGRSCQDLAGPWYARREREAVKSRVQWFNGSVIQMRVRAQTRQK